MRYGLHGTSPRETTLTDEAFWEACLPENRPGHFGFMFEQLQNDPAHLLPEGDETVAALKLLGESMTAKSSSATGNIPAAFTYFGQFVDHDITMTQTPEVDLSQTSLPIFSRNQIVDLFSNGRTGGLDLDSLYDDPAPRLEGKMVLGKTTRALFGSIRAEDRFHDLPRRPMIRDPKTDQEIAEDREALIGDMRNDENLLIAQLHVAFLRAHNALIDRGLSFSEARIGLRRRYQAAILGDYLPRICDPARLERVLRGEFLQPNMRTGDGKLNLPLEFSTAAFRFGHAMVRQEYSHNKTFDPTDFRKLFTTTAMSGDLSENPGQSRLHPTLPDSWIIEWARFFPGERFQNPARKIDTVLAPELANLKDHQGNTIKGIMRLLATRNLLRGYIHRLPTGQAIAQALDIEPLCGQALLDSLPDPVAEVMSAIGLENRTPLWAYILTEAGSSLDGYPDGAHLGPVGSHIVATTLWNLIKHTGEENIIDKPACEDGIPVDEQTLEGIIALGTPLKID